MSRSHKKWEDILSFTALVWLLLLLNLHADRFRFRFDLTAEKRFTISEGTIKLLENLDEVVYVEVFLAGELNADFKRLQKSIRETLGQFQVYAGDNLLFRFTNPDDQPNPQARRTFYQKLVQKGIPATDLLDERGGKKTEKKIFPGALLSYRGRETGVLLLKGNRSGNSASSVEAQLNRAAEDLEYAFAAAIGKLAAPQKKRIAFVEGHGEYTAHQTAEASAALTDFYLVDRTDLQHPDLQSYEALLIVGPQKTFDEADKYRLDQYLMQGGKLLFFVDAVQMNLDSIARGGAYAFGYDLGIEEQLFHYGVRINYNLLQDRQQPGVLEVYAGQFGDRPKIRPFPWPYYIYLSRFGTHPIVKNMDVVLAKFVSAVDTIQSPDIKKTPLMFTSQYTRIRKMPNIVDLNEIRRNMDYSHFKSSFVPVAYLLEGRFNSLYAHRFPPKAVADEPEERLKKSRPTKILVVGDADILRTEAKRSGLPAPSLHYDRFRRQPLSNIEFLQNALAYLTDEEGIITSKKKRLSLRLLDKARLQNEKNYWQLLNLILPVCLVLLFGIVRKYLRKRKFERY